MKNIPTVSVCCITFNQENYIVQTIEGFLMQKTSFPIEIIIHDDASTDNTTKIVREYAEKYPEVIVPIFQTENQYSKRQGNVLTKFVFPRASGKYIAICEGDDYWTDPQKLQRQVDFLEENPDYGLVYTRVKIFEQNENAFLKTTLGRPSKSYESLFLTIGIPTLSTLFRRSFLKDYYTEVVPFAISWRMGDFPLWLFIARHCKLHFIDDVTATYRMLPESASHSKKLSANLIFLKSGFEIRNFFALKYAVSQKVVKRYTMLHYLDTIYLAYLCNDVNHLQNARDYFSKNNYYFLHFFMNFFDPGKKPRVSMQTIDKLMQIYVRYLKRMNVYVVNN